MKRRYGWFRRLINKDIVAFIICLIVIGLPFFIVYEWALPSDHYLPGDRGIKLGEARGTAYLLLLIIVLIISVAVKLSKLRKQEKTKQPKSK